MLAQSLLALPCYWSPFARRTTTRTLLAAVTGSRYWQCNRVQRRKLGTGATGLETTKTTERSSTVFHVLFWGRQLLLTLTLLLGVSLTWLFPPLMAGGVVVRCAT